MKNSNNHLLYIDVLNVISCFAVVFLHANGIFWSHPSGRLWITSNFIETIFYYAVPIFFMISGTTLIDFRSRYNISKYIKKRFIRTFIPFISWSLIFYFYYLYIGILQKYDGNIVLRIINCKIIDIYWFFIPLFAIYCAIPFLSLFNDKLKVFKWMILFSFFTYSLLPFIENLFHISINHNIQFPLSGGFILYVILGYVLANIDLNKNIRGILYVLGLSGLFLHFYMTIVLSANSKYINTLFKGYMNFPCVFYSCSIFIFCKYTDFTELVNKKYIFYIFNLVKKNSLGVYLIHGIFVYTICQKFLHINTCSILYRTIGAILIVFACCIISYFIKKIPIVRIIV